MIGRADPEFRREGKCHRTLFGTTDDSGHIVFHERMDSTRIARAVQRGAGP